MGNTSRRSYGARVRKLAIKMQGDPSFTLFIKELMLSGIEPNTDMTPLLTRKAVRGRKKLVGYRTFMLRRKLRPGEKFQAYQIGLSGRTLYNNSFPVDGETPFIAMGIREGKYKVWGGEGVKVRDQHFDEICDAISYASDVIRKVEW